MSKIQLKSNGFKQFANCQDDILKPRSLKRGINVADNSSFEEDRVAYAAFLKQRSGGKATALDIQANSGALAGGCGARPAPQIAGACAPRTAPQMAGACASRPTLEIA